MITLKEALARTLRSGAASPNPDANASGDRAPTQNQRRLPVPAIPAEHEAPAESAGEAEPAAAPPDAFEAAEETEAFAALALRDQVVIMLLFDQIITEKQVAQVWALWRQEYRGDLKTSLWRLLTLVPELDREMILAESKTDREKALHKLLPFQRKDFEGIFTAMNGLPVTIRLLDPPLHEFLPQTDAEIRELAVALDIGAAEVRAQLDSRREFNPMLGHRGCRLGITFPEIYEMQVRAIALDAINRIDNRLAQRVNNETDNGWRAHYGFGRYQIEQMRNDPSSIEATVPVVTPPGEPIG